jgi:quinoprotein glucose dehydrogenase
VTVSSRLLRRTFGASLAIVLLCTAQTPAVQRAAPAAAQGKLGNMDWPVYRGDQKGNQFVALAQINATNVHKLKPAWEYHTGDASERSTMYANPLIVNGVMYISTPSLKAVALDAATGARLWEFDPVAHNNGRVIRLRNRGVTYWKGPEGERIFDFVGDRVYAVDAKSGKLIQTFGSDGPIDLRQNLGVEPAGVTLEMTTPGSVYKTCSSWVPALTRPTVLRPGTSAATTRPQAS